MIETGKREEVREEGKETVETTEDDKFDYILATSINQSMISVRCALSDYNTKKRAETGDLRVFLKDGKLVFLEEIPRKEGDIAYRLITVERGLLNYILTNAGKWGKLKGDTMTESKITADLLEATLAAGYEGLGYSVPIIEGIYNGVLLDSDFNLIHQKGYNEKTRLYLTHSYPVMEIPENPTKEDIKEIREMFWDIYKEFLFEDTAGEESVDYQNTLAALLTAIARPTWEGTLPIWTVSKSSPRTGGTLLQQVTGCLATGEIPTPQTFPENLTEFEKQTKSILNQGDTFSVIDNVSPGSDWVSPTLLSATGGGKNKVAYRVMGSDVQREAIPPAFAVNGVNLKISADVCGRVIPVRIVSLKSWQAETWKRTKEELCSLAIEKHPEVIRAVSILHRFWEQNGRPKPTSCTGNISEYSHWYNEICGMLWCAGYRKVLSNLRDVQICDNSADVEGAEFVSVLHDTFGGNVFTAKELLGKILEEVDINKRGENYQLVKILNLLDENIAAEAMRKSLTTHRTGHILSKYLDRVFPGCDYKLIKSRGKGKNRGTMEYCLIPVVSQSTLENN